MLGRFLAIDPLASKYPGLSPYVYCANNPIKFRDPDGRWFDTVIDVICIAYDVYDIASTIASGEEVTSDQVLTLVGDVVGAAVPGLTGVGGIIRGAGKADNLVDGIKAADKIADGTKTAKKVPANAGNGRPHGGAKHNEAIDKRIDELKGDKEVRNIRKNQQQVDSDGNNVGRNRPDVQYDKKGKHHNVEFGYNTKRNQAQKERIIVNDPNASVDIVELKE